ncbi:MAG: SDR family NAD(P)-dependent oxidoreductase [Leptolyngbya sp. BL-A-14]
MQPVLPTVSSVIQSMQALVPPGSPAPQDAQILVQLQQLTQSLIQAYQAAGQLQDDPFREARTRQLHLYEADVRSQLAHKVVLVTGGEGCVGSHLIQRLVELGVDRIISVDHGRCCSQLVLQPIEGQQPGVLLYAADVRDYEAQQQIFATEKPDIVFHLAAQRLPGVAEKRIHETITTNVFGTQNIIRLCEEYGVQQCVFSSTGKASRYYTAEVYAATKKVAEWLLAAAAERGRVRYGMVRFTHMLDNSSMCQQIDHKIQQEQPINIHAPNRFVLGQNVGEAVHLLLNALVYSEFGHLKFLLVRNLGWPAESLEVALYKLLESGKQLPIYFEGIQLGYEECFFLGQVNWEKQTDINTLINVLETAYNAQVSSSGDMIVAEVTPFSRHVLMQQLTILKTLCDDSKLLEPEQMMKWGLAKLVQEVAKSSFLGASPQSSLQILKWGVSPKQFQRGELDLRAHQNTVELLVQSLHGRLTKDLLQASQLSLQEFQEILLVLSTLPSVRGEVAYFQAILSGMVPTSLQAA